MPPACYVIESARLGFRRYRPSDEALLLPVFADPYAAQFYPAMGHAEGIARWINWNLKNYEEYGFGLWALELLETGVFIGDAGITYQTVENQKLLEIGWHIHPKYRSQGYATEAGRECLRYGLGSLHAAVLSSIVDPANAASIRVAERVHEQRRAYQGKNGAMYLYYTVAHTAA